MAIADFRSRRPPRRRTARRRGFAHRLARRGSILFLVAITALAAPQLLAPPDATTTAAIAPDPAPSFEVRARFSLCEARAPRVDCVVDGDTFWIGGTKVRIADIDAPETAGASCPEERARGEEATRRLQALLNAAPFEMRAGARDTDRYGRALRTLHRDGRSIGGILVAEGLAREWTGSRRPWCA